MRRLERGSSLIIATIVVLIVAVIGVSILRVSSREVAGAAASQRQTTLITCADAARQLLVSRFHLLGTDPTTIDVLNERLDGANGRILAAGGHIDNAPSPSPGSGSGPLVTIGQVRNAPLGFDAQVFSSDATNVVRASKGGGAGLGGTPLIVTVHCQEGDLSSPTSGRQLEIELGVRFGL